MVIGILLILLMQAKLKHLYHMKVIVKILKKKVEDIFYLSNDDSTISTKVRNRI
jgi:hypothetical protein